jgi:ABC-type nitrate/sulfonate/bicarbonate transport system substrate-binding protein
VIQSTKRTIFDVSCADPNIICVYVQREEEFMKDFQGKVAVIKGAASTNMGLRKMAEAAGLSDGN